MMRFCQPASILLSILVSLMCLLPSLVNGVDSGGEGSMSDATTQVEKNISSSAFEVVLYPSSQQLDALGKWELQNAIKTSIFLSSSMTTSFIAVADVEVLLRNVDFEENFELEGGLSLPVSLVGFEILMTFSFPDSNNAVLPSRNGVDNLIARAFSQPSSKSTFIVILGLGRDPILNEVEDIEIYLVKNSTSSPATEIQNGSLSTIDIVLIILSLLVFVAILCVLYHYHKNWTSLEESRHSYSYTKEPKNPATSPAEIDDHITPQVNQGSATEHEDESTVIHANLDRCGDTDIDGHDCLSDMIAIERNISSADSSENSVERKSRMIVPCAESREMSDASSTTGKDGRVESSSMDSSDDDSTSAASSNASNTSDLMSADSSSIATKLLGAAQPDYGRNQDSNSSATSDQMSVDNTSTFSKLLGAEQPDNGSKPDSNLSTTSDQTSTDHTSISSKLLGAEQPDYGRTLESPRGMSDDILFFLPGGGAFMLNDVNTFDSAPPTLEHYHLRSKTEVTFRDEKSDASARSAASSDESEPSSQRDDQNSVSTYRCRPGGSTSSAISDSSGISEMVELFRDNWLESKRKAVEDTEDGSIDDIFQVGVQRTATPDERHINGPSLRISEFLNSVRVAGSVSETPEDSSIELKSLYSTKDNYSTDVSLEQSMADSIVEI